MSIVIIHDQPLKSEKCLHFNTYTLKSNKKIKCKFPFEENRRKERYDKIRLK